MTGHRSAWHDFQNTTGKRTSGSAWLYKHQWITCQKNKPNKSITYVTCDSKLRSVLRSGTCGRIHAQTGNWVAIGRAVVHYACSAHSFSARSKCQYCRQVNGSLAPCASRCSITSTVLNVNCPLYTEKRISGVLPVAVLTLLLLVVVANFPNTK